MNGKQNKDYILLGVIITAGTILRFYHFPEIPFTYDEFSALWRTKFDNFADLIRYGVKIDAHPAGVHVFLYYWTKLFGDSEPVVKLPFAISGVFSIFLTYKIAAKWFNGTAGLISAAYIAVIQYTVMYSVIARPYGSGLFLGLLMVWFWTNAVFSCEKNYYRNLAGFIIAAAMNAYNHHFSLLLAALTGFSGLFFIPKKHLKSYIIAGLIIFLLYVPHLPIFFAQLSYKGVEEWLGKPDPYFILGYFGFVLHYSLPFYILTALLFIYGLYFKSQDLKRNNKFRITGFMWFLITFLAGYLYSLYISAILQISVLIFAFPYLLISFFSFIKELDFKRKAIIVMLILSTGIYTLSVDRQYFNYFYKSGFEEILKETVSVREKIDDEDINVFFNTIDRINDYYIHKDGLNPGKIRHFDEFSSFIEFREYLKNCPQDYLVIAWATSYPGLEYLQIAEDIYPYIIEKKTWFLSSFYLLKRTKPANRDFKSAGKIVFQTVNDYEDTIVSGWDTVPGYLIRPALDRKENHYLACYDWVSYSPGIKLELDTIINDENNLLFISVDAYFVSDTSNVNLIAFISRNDSVIYYKTARFTKFISKKLERQTVYLPIKLPDVKMHGKHFKIRTFIWNNSASYFYIDDFRIITREANPVIYGQFEKFTMNYDDNM